MADWDRSGGGEVRREKGGPRKKKIFLSCKERKKRRFGLGGWYVLPDGITGGQKNGGWD